MTTNRKVVVVVTTTMEDLGSTLSIVAWWMFMFAMIWLNYRLWIVPMNRIRSLEDVGYAHLKMGSAKRKKERINQIRNGREFGHPPPPFPNGWFVLAESSEVNVGSILQVNALGNQFVIYRGKESGNVFVTDAICPHLGANFSFGGKVVGDDIQCPFHLWRFDGKSGECTVVPYSTTVPSCARVRTWTATEVNNLIYVWHHCERLEPTWFPDPVEQLGIWTYRGRSEYQVSCHIQDIPENGADVAHLNAIHQVSMIAGGEPSSVIEKITGWSYHDWGSLEWNPRDPLGENPGLKHCARVKLQHKMNLFGAIDILKLKIVGEQIGPATVHLSFDSIFGKGVMIQYILPVEPMLQKLVHVFYTEKSFIAPFAKLVLLGESILLERDIKVWNQKSYLDKPILVKEDRLVGRHRRWYSQFYSKSSMTLQDALKTGSKLDW